MHVLIPLGQQHTPMAQAGKSARGSLGKHVEVLRRLRDQSQHAIVGPAGQQI